MHDIDKQLDELIRRYEGNWSAGYDAFPALVHKLGLRKGAEVGVAFGGHAGAILEKGGVEKLYGVDRYRHTPGYDDPMNLPQPVFDRLAERVVERLATFNNRFELIREDSANGSAKIKDGGLDFVYLDADHSEAGVMNDLTHWAVKVREGGIIAGHDYGHSSFPGVKRAVDRYFARFGWAVHELGNGVWWVKREALPISFFSPCYNCAPWIRETAQSVLQGNLQPGDEYLLVNDGSSDETAQALDELAGQSPAVRVIAHEQNRGGGVTRNTAVIHARHRLLVCLDSDNRLPAGLAERFRRHLLCSDAEVLVPEVMRYFQDAADSETDGLLHESHRASYPTGRASFADYLGGRCGGHAPASGGNLLFTRDAYERADGFPRDAGALDAWGFGLRLAGTNAAIDVVPGTSYWHRCGHDSYWTRHRRDGSMGHAATELIKPFLHRVHPADRRYILGAGAGRWYFERSKRGGFRTTGSDKAPRPCLRQGLAALMQRLNPARRQYGQRDTARLRLVLGLGRSGTTWTHSVLSHCGEMRAYAEPLHYLRPRLRISDSPDRAASGFVDQLPPAHPLLRAYTDLCADRPPRVSDIKRTMTQAAERPEAVLVKEVHALLATPGLLKATQARAIIITRDPLRIADSIFACQGLDSPYLHHEFAACNDSRLLSWIGGPAQTAQRLAVWEQIDSIAQAQDRRVLSVVWAAAIVQRVLIEAAHRMPERVALISYEQANANPAATFRLAADHLGLTFGKAAEDFCNQTRSRDESQNPYSVFRDPAQEASWRFITPAQREKAIALLSQGGLGFTLTTPETAGQIIEPATTPPTKKCA